MNGELVGEWWVDVRGQHVFRYDRSWLNRPNARPLSLSMPLRLHEVYRGDVVANYFENLLPDNRSIRQRIQARFGANSTRAFDLLSEIGRDCVGAVQLLPEETQPGDVGLIQGEPLDALKIEEVLNQQGGQWGASALSEFRISLAGTQEKTALLRHDGMWKRPIGSTPTTHILKLPLGRLHTIDLSTSVENEWLCHRILCELGIPVAPCQIESFGETKVLVVERFDRRWAGQRLLRLPQEDMCQATGTSPALKYENEGGPGVETIFKLLLGSSQALSDRRDFLKTLLAFWLLAAMDGHAKNFSIFLRPQGHYSLTPRYDVLSAHPVIGHGVGKIPRQQVKMAMRIWGKQTHYHWDHMKRSHWRTTSADCGMAGQFEEVVDEILACTPPALDRVRGSLPADFPGWLAESILGGTQASLDRLMGDSS